VLQERPIPGGLDVVFAAEKSPVVPAPDVDPDEEVVLAPSFI
jgi:hypothetical protein